MLAATAALLLAAQGASSSPIEGRWRSPGGNSIINVAPCGDSWCGTVAWASAKAKKAASRTTTQLIGTQILSEVRPAGSERWNGRLFIPDRNMRVTAKIEVAPGGQLKVSGCLVGKSMCKSQLWTAVEGPLPAPE
jgi:uncharacterized protein (DUF2147 family)